MIKLSKEGVDLLILNEGFREKAYQCSRKKWTVGYGSTWNYDEQRPVKEGDIVTKQEAKDWKDLAVDDIEGWINTRGWELNQSQFDALVSLIYNVGIGRFKKYKLYFYIGTKNWGNVRVSWLSINKVRNPETGILQISKGLVERRKREWDLFSKDLW